jgi:hypothetical protein
MALLEAKPEAETGAAPVGIAITTVISIGPIVAIGPTVVAVIAVGSIAVAVSIRSYISPTPPIAAAYFLNHPGVCFTVVDGRCSSSCRRLWCRPDGGDGNTASNDWSEISPHSELSYFDRHHIGLFNAGSSLQFPAAA